MILYKKEQRLGKPNIEQIEQKAKHYDKIYTTNYHIENYRPIYDKVIEYISKYNNQNELAILDIGCGIGELATRLKEVIDKNNYLGFDFSSLGLKKAKERNPEWRDRFLEHDIYNIDKLSFNYDIAVALEVLEHIQDLTLINGLKSGTLFIGSVPNYWSSNNEHLRVYSSKFYIWKRFRKKMSFKEWHKHKLNKHRFIYVFIAEIR